MAPLEVLAIVFELLAWFGLPLGVLLLLVVFVVHAFDGGWEPTDLVVVDGPDGRIARWYAGDEFFERALHHDEAHRIGDAEEFPAFTARNSPSSMQLEPRRPAMQLVRVLAYLFGAIGVVGLIGAIVCLFLGA